jgi:hypothetical protein
MHNAYEWRHHHTCYYSRFDTISAPGLVEPPETEAERELDRLDATETGYLHTERWPELEEAEAVREWMRQYAEDIV